MTTLASLHRAVETGWYRAAIVALLLIFVILSSSSASRKSATYDETAYLGTGAYILKLHRFDDVAIVRHPVFWTVWHDLPLLVISKIPNSLWQEDDAVLRGQKIIALRKDDLLLNACRFMLLPFGVILGLLVFHWSRELYGISGGLMSLTVYCFCPNILAHAPLITPDMTFSFFVVLTTWRLWKLAKKDSIRNLVWAGASLALMLLSKHTGLLVGLILLITDVVYRSADNQINWRSWRRIWRGLRRWPILIAMAALVVWAAYGFQVAPVSWPSGTQTWFPAAPYVQGAIIQYQQSRQPHSFFLMGMNSSSGWWYYFIVVCSIKIPVSVLLLLGGLVLGRRWLGSRFSVNEVFLAVPFGLLFLYLSCFNTIQNGFRYLLPVYPLLITMLGSYGPAVHRSLAARISSGLLILWLVIGSLVAWPNYISYFNELIGGSRQGYHWLGDSNIDWGQDLKELRSFMGDRGIDRIQLSYFGTADPTHYEVNYEYLPSSNSPLQPTPPLPDGQKPARFLAISAYDYQGIGFDEKKEENVYRFLYDYVPNDIVGRSILIFDTTALKPRTRPPLPFLLRQFVGLERRNAPLNLYP